jgi:hypothetical protein
MKLCVTELRVFLTPLRKEKGAQHTQTDLEQQSASIFRVFQKTEASLCSELQSSPNLGLLCKWSHQAPLKHL